MQISVAWLRLWEVKQRAKVVIEVISSCRVNDASDDGGEVEWETLQETRHKTQDTRKNEEVTEQSTWGSRSAFPLSLNWIRGPLGGSQRLNPMCPTPKAKPLVTTRNTTYYILELRFEVHIGPRSRMTAGLRNGVPDDQ